MFHIGSKGQLANLSGLAMTIVVFAVVVVAGALILGKFAENTTVASDTIANETVVTAQTGLSDLISWLPLLIVIIIAIVILGYFGMKHRGVGRA